jgi:hypothetical protein
MEKDKVTLLAEEISILVKQTGEFILEQAPLIVQEFYRWELISHTMGCFFFIPFLIMFMYGMKQVRIDNCWDDKPLNFFNLIIGCIGLLFGIGFFIEGAYNIVFMIVAPKLYLIEYFVK